MSQSSTHYRGVTPAGDNKSIISNEKDQDRKPRHRGKKTAPGGKRLYKLAFTIHKWSGLFAALWLAVLGFTGFFLTQDTKRGLQQAIVPAFLTTKPLQINAQRNAMRLWQVDPNDSKYHLSGGSRGLWWSADSAVHWEKTSFDIPATPQIFVIEPDPQLGWEKIWLGTDDGMFASIDKGVTAHQVSLAGDMITSIVAGSDPSEMLGVIDRTTLFKFKTASPDKIEYISIASLDKTAQPQETRLHKYLRSLHFGRGLFDADTSRLINQFGAVALFILSTTGLLYWGLPKIWMARTKSGRSTDPNVKRETIVWLFRLHGATFGIMAAPILLYLAITGIIIGHDKELGWWMRGTRIKNEYFTPALKLSSWEGRIDAIAGYPGKTDRFSIGNHFGLFTTNDNGKTWHRDQDTTGDAIGGASRMRRIGDKLFIMAGMGNTAISRTDDYSFMNYGVPDQIPIAKQNFGRSQDPRNMMVARSEHGPMASHPSAMDAGKMMDTKFMPQDVTVIDGEFYWKSGNKLYSSGVNGNQPMPTSMTGPAIQGVPLWMWYRQIHTGMLFWSEWRWVNDVFGLSAVFLVVTGVIRWWRQKWI